MLIFCGTYKESGAPLYPLFPMTFVPLYIIILYNVFSSI